jgi:coenzyme Q-binding protein COQ10
LPVFETKRRVNVPATIAYEVASDVSAYKDFLPLMQRSSVLGTKRKTAVGEAFDAELAVSYPKLGLNGNFVSTVNTNVEGRTVSATSIDGPFRHVETKWAVFAAPGGCDVSIRIDYAFRNPLMQLAAAGLMEMAIGKVMSAFEARAMNMLAQRKLLEQA